MSGKKPTFQPWQSNRKSKAFSLVSRDMLLSTAWQALNPTAVKLYICCLDQLGYKPPTVTGDASNDRDYFVMNRELWRDRYRVTSSPNVFMRAMRNLVSHGFVEVYRSGKNTRTKTIYKFSGQWKSWTAKEKLDLKGASLAFTKGSPPIDDSS